MVGDKNRKIKRISMGFAYIILLISTAAVTAQAAPALVSVSPPSIEASYGQTVTVTINVDPGGNEICAAQYLLYFDQRILNATSQSQGTFLSQDGIGTLEIANIIDNTAGKMEYGEIRTDEGLEHGVTTSGILASISFEVVEESAMCDLKLSDVILVDRNGKNIGAEIDDGRCTIGAATGEPVTDVTVEEAYTMMETNPKEITLLDVRAKEEHDAEHIQVQGVLLKHVPLSELESRLDEPDKSKKVIVYSGDGVSSRTASDTLVQNGFKDIYNMLGGMAEWRISFPVSTRIAPTATPTQASGGSGDNGGQSASHTQNPIPTSTPSPTQTAGLTSTPIPTAISLPSASPTTDTSRNPEASTPRSEDKSNKLPGFEASFVITGLIMIAHLILKEKGGDKNE
ncbi:MAG: rhodanese-like domain-containing protein [Euryarchaeota archaeon]|nr:rhodanese-like domain-containing protein [Euryarchaeota archaeon]